MTRGAEPGRACLWEGMLVGGHGRATLSTNSNAMIVRRLLVVNYMFRKLVKLYLFKIEFQAFLLKPVK